MRSRRRNSTRSRPRRWPRARTRSRPFTSRLRSAELFVYQWGDDGAPALLYWDGLGGTGLHANELAPILVRQYGFRVIAPDPPGHGRSPPRAPDAYLPSAQAQVAAELLDELGVGEAVFVGFSVGAEVACAFGARYPGRTTALVLVDGGYWDFADLPDFDVGAGLATRVERARKQAGDEVYPTWEAYFEAERSAIGRWTPDVEAAHRATMREREGRIEPVIAPETVGGIRHGNCVEPTVSTHEALRRARVPTLLVTPARHGRRESLARGGIRRFRDNVPQLVVEELDTDVHDLVSRIGPDLAALIGSWLTHRGWCFPPPMPI